MTSIRITHSGPAPVFSGGGHVDIRVKGYDPDSDSSLRQTVETVSACAASLVMIALGSAEAELDEVTFQDGEE